MHESSIILATGTVLVFAVLGIGKLAIRLLNLVALPWYWDLALTAILGQAAIDLLVQALLLSGASSASRLKLLGWLAIALGLCGHFLKLKRRARHRHAQQSGRFRGNYFLKTLLILAWVTNLAVALAPSSKIDELFYDMLIPRRIAADGNMNFYRLPIEAAIVPQTPFQISLSPGYALGAPEAGNILSLSYSIILGLFIIGFIEDMKGSSSLALLGGLGCVAGVYHTVWHTTEGTAAIGELSLVVALCGLLWPEKLIDAVRPFWYALLIVTASSLAASTKLSLWPFCAIISLLACWKISPAKSGLKMPAILAALAIPWIVIQAPLMVWTYHESGSFWGPVMANVFHSSIFPPALLGILNEMRVINQTRFLLNMLYAALELPLLIFAGVALLILNVLRSRGRENTGLILSLMALQGVLIWWLLPYDFRFLGGLLYLPLICSVLMMKTSNDQNAHSRLIPLGGRIVSFRNWIAVVCVVPWLAFQLYYARPFLRVTAGLVSRAQFRERYIPLTHDYEVLDHILPAGAVLYFANGRVSLYDAPRPVVLTPLDLRQKISIYRLTLIDMPDAEAFKPGSVLMCDQIVYENDRAVIEAYRQPKKVNKTGKIVVKACRIQQSAQSSLLPNVPKLSVPDKHPAPADAGSRLLSWMALVSEAR